VTAPLHVLLVEDSAADARLVQEDLRDAAPGEVVLTRVSTATAAATRLAAEHVDCVLLDLSLPDAHELAAAATLRTAAPD